MTERDRFGVVSRVLRGVAGFASIGAILDVAINGMQFLMQASELIFPALSIVYGTIGREVGIGFLTSDQLGYLVVFFAVMYVAHLAIQFKEGLRNGDFDEN